MVHVEPGTDGRACGRVHTNLGGRAPEQGARGDALRTVPVHGAPLYAGSTVIAGGIAIAARNPAAAAVVALYMGFTIAAAIRVEEMELRRAFGSAYDDYRSSRAAPMDRRFSLRRAIDNREHRAVAGLLGGFALLALRMLVLSLSYNGLFVLPSRTRSG